MLMHPSPNPDSKELPIALYESEMHMVEEEMQTIFVPCDFHLETTQAEMVTMEEVAKGINLNGSSTLDPHLASLRVSLGALNNRANSLLAFLEATKKSHIPMNHQLLRQVAAICQQLPTMDRETLRGILREDYNDSLVCSYLATVTNSIGHISELTEKFSQMETTSRSHRL